MFDAGRQIRADDLSPLKKRLVAQGWAWRCQALQGMWFYVGWKLFCMAVCIGMIGFAFCAEKLVGIQEIMLGIGC